MKIVFHDNTLTERGTSVALFDYADFSERLLGNTSFIAYLDVGSGNNPLVVKKFRDRFGDRVISYKTHDELEYFAKCLSIDVAYFIKSGENDGKILKSNFNVIHAVFQRYDPHGQRYAYVSKWLSQKVSNGTVPFVPHMVSLPNATGSIRTSLGIPHDALVVGRIGGFEQFNIPFVQAVIIDFILSTPSAWFVCVNTKQFFSHPRFIYLPTIVDPVIKARYIDSCDLMLHGRKEGESFGIAIAEFMTFGKPVLTWRGGIDQNQTYMVPEVFVYNDHNDLRHKLYWLLLEYSGELVQAIKDAVADYRPEIVMKKFAHVFLRS